MGPIAVKVCLLFALICLLKIDANFLPECQANSIHSEPGASKQNSPDERPEVRASNDRRIFSLELLKSLYEEYGESSKKSMNLGNEIRGESKDSFSLKPSASTSQLLSALSADGDFGRLLDWIRNSFNLASIGELTTQFVVSKLGSINCAAILQPDAEESLVPRFLLFNEHFQDVPYEMQMRVSKQDCSMQDSRFDANRKTILLLHGYLGGYTIVDGLTNIKNRLIDSNKFINENLIRLSSGIVNEKKRSRNNNNGSSLNYMEEIESKLRSQQYNVIIVDWFNGANPIVRSRYIRAAVNAQVVGKLIARFLVALMRQCQTPASKMQIIAHSLGCHVAGFTGKSFQELSGQRLGKITHLDPVGLCFGRLFSQPKYRLHPKDALETQAVHVSLNLFDNPLDGAQENFLVNGGRDQIGCGGQSELKNSTSSSVSLLFDSQTKFVPCSHVRALALFEDDYSSASGNQQCQIVGFRCANYDKFLAGKCGHCDDQNGQCRLMSLPSLEYGNFHMNHEKRSNGVLQHLASNSSIGEANDVSRIGQPEMLPPSSDGHMRRSDRMVHVFEREREFLALAIGKLKSEARNVLDNLGGEMRVNSLVNYKNVLSSASELLSPEPKQAAEPMDGPQEGANKEPAPIGSQALPLGSVNGPQYFVGTSSLSPYCVNYYQLRILIAEWRLNEFLINEKSAKRLQSAQIDSAPPLDLGQFVGQNRGPALHLTVKLIDNSGHFFKGLSLIESVQALARWPSDSNLQVPSGLQQVFKRQAFVELTMLLNTTRLEPVRISETVVSYYFHKILLADLIQINYMSNINPSIRAKYSSNLCPEAINDKHKLVRYTDCQLKD